MVSFSVVSKKTDLVLFCLSGCFPLFRILQIIYLICNKISIIYNDFKYLFLVYSTYWYKKLIFRLHICMYIGVFLNSRLLKFLIYKYIYKKLINKKELCKLPYLLWMRWSRFYEYKRINKNATIFGIVMSVIRLHLIADVINEMFQNSLTLI